jgi:hypothetical protein
MDFYFEIDSNEVEIAQVSIILPSVSFIHWGPLTCTVNSVNKVPCSAPLLSRELTGEPTYALQLQIE